MGLAARAAEERVDAFSACPSRLSGSVLTSLLLNRSPDKQSDLESGDEQRPLLGKRKGRVSDVANEHFRTPGPGLAPSRELSPELFDDARSVFGGMVGSARNSLGGENRDSRPALDAFLSLLEKDGFPPGTECRFFVEAIGKWVGCTVPTREELGLFSDEEVQGFVERYEGPMIWDDGQTEWV